MTIKSRIRTLLARNRPKTQNHVTNLKSQ